MGMVAMTSSLRAVAMAIVALAISSGCAPRVSGEPVTINAMRPRIHPADAMPAAARLPSDCLAFVQSRDLSLLLEALQRDAVKERFAEIWERATFEIARETGLNPLSLDGLTELGIDVRAEVGAALLSSGEPDAVVFFHLASPDRFKTRLYQALRSRRFEPRVVDGVVLVGADDVMLAIDDDLVMVFVGRHPEEAALRAVVLDEEDSLAGHRPFRVALRQLESVPLVVGWVDPRGLAYMTAGLDPRWGGTSYGQALARIERQARDQLTEARARGATPDELVSIDEHYAQAQAGLRRDRRASGLRHLIGDVEGAGLAFDLSPEGARLRLYVDTAEGALAKRIWQNGAGVPRVVRALDREPLALLSLGLDLEALREAVEEDPEAAELMRPLARVAGGAELTDLLTGAFEVAVQAPDGWGGGLEDLRLGAILGLRDHEAVHGVLDGLAELGEGPLRRTEDGWRLSLPDLPVMTLTLAEGRLVGATDEELLSRLVAGEAGGFEPERALRVVERGGSALTMAMAAGVLVMGEMRGSAMWMAESSTKRWHGEGVPPSQAYRDKEAEIEALEARLGEQMMAVERERRERLIELVRPLGHVAASLRATQHGLDIEVRYQTGVGTLVGVAADFLHASKGTGPMGPERRRLEALWAQRDALAAELDAIHERDRANREENRRR